MKISKTVKLGLSIALVSMFVGCGDTEDDKKDTPNSTNQQENGNSSGDNNSNSGNGNDSEIKASKIPFIMKVKPSSKNVIMLSTNNKYKYSIDWGDGTSDQEITEGKGHVYPNSEIYTVSITGTYQTVPFNCRNDFTGTLISVEQWGDTVWKTMEEAFQFCSELTIPAEDTPNLSQVKSMSSMFNRATNFNQDISSWDVSNVEDMSQLFRDARSFNQDISSWNVSNVKNMVQMFDGAINFNQDISSWDISNVESLAGTFTDAQSFNQDISSWDFSKINYLALYNAHSFNQDLSSIDFSNMKEINMKGTNISTENYDKLLLSWINGNIQKNFVVDMGNIQYSKKAESAKFELINKYNWSISDGGLAK